MFASLRLNLPLRRFCEQVINQSIKREVLMQSIDNILDGAAREGT